MASNENTPHVQVKFFTKQPQYSVPDSPFSVPATVGVGELSSLINSLLNQDGRSDKDISFDFLVDGEFLRISLQQHMENKNISTETVLDIEYVERYPAPEPEDSLLHDDWVSCVQAAGDYILSGCYDNSVRLWNTEGELQMTIPGHNGPVKCCAWIHQDDEDPVHRFVTGSHDETLLMWQWDQQKNSVECAHICRGHAGSVDCVAVDPTKLRFCSGSWDKMLKIWSSVAPADVDDENDAGEKPHKRKKTNDAKVATKVPVMTLSGHNEGISAVHWMSEGQICTASWDHTIRLWDVEQAVEKSTLNGTKVFLDMSYSHRNNMIVAASADRHIRLYDPRITDGAIVQSTFTSHNAWVSGVSWSPHNDFLFLSGAYDALLKLWDTRSPKAPLYDMSGHEDKVLTVDWTIPQHMLSGGADNHLKIFRPTDTNTYLPRSAAS